MKDSRLGRGRGYPSLASEGQGNLLDRRWLGEIENDIAAEQRGGHVDAGTSEDECVRVDHDVDVDGLVTFVGSAHVVRGMGVVAGVGVVGGRLGILLNLTGRAC